MGWRGRDSTWTSTTERRIAPRRTSAVPAPLQARRWRRSEDPQDAKDVLEAWEGEARVKEDGGTRSEAEIDHTRRSRRTCFDAEVEPPKVAQGVTGAALLHETASHRRARIPARREGPRTTLHTQGRRKPYLHRENRKIRYERQKTTAKHKCRR